MSNNKIVIFEGHDRAGKTSISSEFAHQTGLQIFKNHNQLKNFATRSFANSVFIEANYIYQMLQQCQFAGGGIIFDRSMPSEYVYSKVFGRKTDLQMIEVFDEALAQLGAKIIYCHKDIDFSSKFSDEVVAYSNLEQIKAAYEEYFAFTKCQVLKLETSDENLADQISTVRSFIGV
jgi:xylose isomerase